MKRIWDLGFGIWDFGLWRLNPRFSVAIGQSKIQNPKSKIVAPRPRFGFTLIEAVMSMLIVSGLLVAALQTIAITSLTQFKTNQRSNGWVLADGLIADVMLRSYEEPGGAAVFGLDAGELAASKINYDDVDDFDGWTESPPQNPDGTAMQLAPGWQRSVAVVRVNPANVSEPSVTETGAKRITVTVARDNVVLATRTVIRTNVP